MVTVRYRRGTRVRLGPWIWSRFRTFSGYMRYDTRGEVKILKVTLTLRMKRSKLRPALAEHKEKTL